MPSPAMPPPVADGPGSFFQQAIIDSRVICAVARFCGRWRGQSTVRLCRLGEGRGVVAWAADGHSAALALDPTGILEADVEFELKKGDLEKLRPLSSANQERRFVLDESGGAFAETLRFPQKGLPSSSRVSLLAEVPHEAYAPPVLQALRAAVQIAADRAEGRTPDLALRSFGVNTALLTRALEAFVVMQGKEDEGVPVQVEAAGSGPVVMSAPGAPLWVVLMPLRREAPLPAPDWAQAFLASR